MDSSTPYRSVSIRFKASDPSHSILTGEELLNSVPEKLILNALSRKKNKLRIYLSATWNIICSEV